jgi:hypothetical protein
MAEFVCRAMKSLLLVLEMRTGHARQAPEVNGEDKNRAALTARRLGFQTEADKESESG